MGSSGSSGKGGTTYITQSDFNAREAKAQAKYKQQGADGVAGIQGSEASGGEKGEAYKYEGIPGQTDWAGAWKHAVKPILQTASNPLGIVKTGYDVYSNYNDKQENKTNARKSAVASAKAAAGKNTSAGSSLGSTDDSYESSGSLLG